MQDYYYCLNHKHNVVKCKKNYRYNYNKYNKLFFPNKPKKSSRWLFKWLLIGWLLICLKAKLFTTSD